MINAIVELLMSEYFLTKAVLGRYSGDGKDVFNALGRIFLIPEGEAEGLYALAENETARAISTEKEYMQRQRLRTYSRLIGEKQTENAEWEEVARIKGDAILLAHKYSLIPPADASRNTAYAYLNDAAAGGLVCALRICGILQCEGIFLDRDEGSGIRALSKAADWNDVTGTLALLHYRSKERGYNVARLKREVAGTPFGGLYSAAAERYGAADCAETEAVKLLDKAFSSGVLKRESYDPKYARILNGSALNVRDKEKTVFALNKEGLCAVSDLPVKLTHKKIAEVRGVGGAAIVRRAEADAINRALKNGDLRGVSSYRPLCLCCDCRYVLNMYARAISEENAAVHTEIIDVASLNDCDFEPTGNNVFIRSIDEDRDNRLLIFLRGDISEKKREAVKGILQSDTRAKLRLSVPAVTLDLSAALPVCFADARNARWLAPCCDEIKLDGISGEELPLAIGDIAAGMRELYGVGEIKFDGGVEEIFAGFDIDEAERLTDAAVRARRERGADIALTREAIKEYAVDGDPAIGFGGEGNGR